MTEQAIRDILSGRRRGVAPALLRAAMRVACVPYATAMRVRRWKYRKGIVRSHPAAGGAAVISVGNITTGGTGKTPMVVWVARQLVAAGRRPAVLIRGYKAAGGRSDEAELLRNTLKPVSAAWSTPVIVGPDRVAASRQAADARANVMVMDDGFQHRRLRRDLDIVLIDATNPFGYGYCLPRGLLREPLSALRDADAIVITRSDAVAEDELAELERRLTKLSPRASLHRAAHQPAAVIDQTGAAVPLAALAGRKVFAFCGIGNPQGFFDTLRRLGASVAGERPLDDHATYDKTAVDDICRQATQRGAEVLLTTQKDAVKLSGIACPMPLWQLAVEMRIVQGEDELTKKIVGVVSNAAP